MDKITLWFIIGFVVVVIAVVVVAGVMSGGFGTSNPSAPPGFVATMTSPVTSADWKEADLNATTTLIEYGDYECPACGEYESIIQQLLQDYGGKIMFVFRNFPLYTIHPDAGIAAQAAEAAGLQGKFWEMHDLLYAKQSEWVSATPDVVVTQYFNGYASSLGLNVQKFDADINSTAVMNKIQADVTSANAASVDHTPTFFVNLTQIPNPGNYSDFQSALNAALSSSTPTTTTGGGPSSTIPFGAGATTPATAQ